MKNTRLYVLRGRISTIPSHPIHLLDEGRINLLIDDGLHHGQVLKIIVRLEQGVAGKELD